MNLKRVIEGENIKITEQAFETLLFIADGDMRQAINNLQACFFASQGIPFFKFRINYQLKYGAAYLRCPLGRRYQANHKTSISQRH